MRIYTGHKFILSYYFDDNNQRWLVIDDKEVDEIYEIRYPNGLNVYYSNSKKRFVFRHIRYDRSALVRTIKRDLTTSSEDLLRVYRNYLTAVFRDNVFLLDTNVSRAHSITLKEQNGKLPFIYHDRNSNKLSYYDPITKEVNYICSLNNPAVPELERKYSKMMVDKLSPYKVTKSQILDSLTRVKPKGT